MKRLLIATLLIFATSSFLQADNNQTKATSKDDFFAKYMAMKQKTKETRELRKSVEKLTNTTNKLANTLKVDK